MIKMIFAAPALLVATSGIASAAVDRSTGLPLESKAQIYARCGIDLTSPNAIADAAGAPCYVVGVLATLQPKEDPRDND